MVDIFNTILDMSINASVVILAVMVLRILFYKAPKRYSYLLWAVVGFRLCCPVSFESIISIFSLGRLKAPTLPNVGGDIIIDAAGSGRPDINVDDPQFVTGGNASVEFIEKTAENTGLFCCVKA